ncbi:MAG: rod shape-determining protein MreD [Gammaproteobacteria bacterium]|nr:rod shape-determining protein MreD [Gammaproteobacteria bacterium]
MPLVRHNAGWVILASFVLAFLLTTIPLPGWSADWRPAWVVMMVIYWCIVLPERVGVAIAWILGLLLDVYTGSLLGQNALGLSVIAYLTLRLHKQIRIFPPLQQSVLICIYLLLFQFFTLWIRGIIGVPPQHWTFWAPVLSSMFLWPIFFMLMRSVRRKFNVY